MKERELGQALLTAPVPEELDAQRRTWSVVRTAFAEREPVPRHRRRLRPVLVLAGLAAVVVAAVSPPGRAVGDWIRERVEGAENAEPALFRLPAPGRLLVVSERGPWVVRADGSKRLLGSYSGASWSPNGYFVVVTRGRRLVAVEPDGDPRWSLTRPGTVTQARWSLGEGFRVAYREAETLRVVDGDGTGDRLLARGVAPVAVAWRPQRAGEYVLAYADRRGRVHVVDVDSGRDLWRSRPGPALRQLQWAPDGRALLALTEGNRHPLYRGNGRLARVLAQPRGRIALRASFAPDSASLAYTELDPVAERGSVVLEAAGVRRTLFTGAGRLEDVAWSPDGRWLLAGWPDADQWLFLRVPAVGRLRAVEGITQEFDPGGPGGPGFPRVAGWCCSG